MKQICREFHIRRCERAFSGALVFTFSRSFFFLSHIFRLADEIVYALAQQRYNLYILFMLFLNDYSVFFRWFASALAASQIAPAEWSKLITSIHKAHKIKINEREKRRKKHHPHNEYFSKNDNRKFIVSVWTYSAKEHILKRDRAETISQATWTLGNKLNVRFCVQ